LYFIIDTFLHNHKIKELKRTGSFQKSLPFILSILVKIKFCKSLCPIAITESYHLVFGKHIFLCSSVLAADAAVDACILIVEHIDVEVSHKAGWTSVI